MLSLVIQYNIFLITIMLTFGPIAENLWNLLTLSELAEQRATGQVSCPLYPQLRDHQLYMGKDQKKASCRSKDSVDEEDQTGRADGQQV